MLSLEQNQVERITRIKECEQNYERQLRELQMKYSAKRKKMKQAHQHEMKLLEEEGGHGHEEGQSAAVDAIPDTFFAEAVVSEILQIRSEQMAHRRKHKRTPNKLRELVDEMESHFRLLHTIMNAAEY